MKNCHLLLGILFALCVANQVFSAPADSNLDAALPWLKDVLNEDDNLILPAGNYKLGSNETISVHPPCSNTPFKFIVGECTLLKDCSKMHYKLTSVNDYVESFCLLENGYAGVCCPVNVDANIGPFLRT